MNEPNAFMSLSTMLTAQNIPVIHWSKTTLQLRVDAVVFITGTCRRGLSVVERRNSVVLQPRIVEDTKSLEKVRSTIFGPAAFRICASAHYIQTVVSYGVDANIT